MTILEANEKILELANRLHYVATAELSKGDLACYCNWAVLEAIRDLHQLVVNMSPPGELDYSELLSTRTLRD